MIDIGDVITVYGIPFKVLSRTTLYKTVGQMRMRERIQISIYAPDYFKQSFIFFIPANESDDYYLVLRAAERRLHEA